MEDFNRFNKENNENQDISRQEESTADHVAQGNGVNADDNVSHVDNSSVYPQWYGVSYSGSENTMHGPSSPWQTVEQQKKRRHKKIGFVALLLAACMLFTAAVGVGGYKIAEHLYEKNQQNEQNSNNPYLPTDTNGAVNNANVYEKGNAEQYDYASVVIEKNDGSTLVNSTNGSAGDSALSRIAAVAAVRDAVVEISTTVMSYGTLQAGAGSGVIIHADGIIVTNNHVIDNANSIYVTLTNGNTYEAYLRGTDEENDIAILKITPQEILTVAKLGSSSSLAVGEDVFAIGNPLGQLGGTVTTGIISALEREVSMEEGTMTLLQTNAAINSGNSGGGLFNMAGELIGVVNAKYSATGVEGLGFAIPVDTAMISIDSLLKYGYIKGRASLGVTVSQKVVIMQNGLVYMPYVYAAGTASVLKTSDLIYKIDDTVVATTDGTSVSALKRAVRSHSVGDTVKLTIYRNNQSMTIDVTLVEEVPDN